MKKQLLAGVGAIALVMGSVQVAEANLIVNGSFEVASSGASNPGSGSFSTLGTSGTAIRGWSITGGTVDWINGYWQASDGTHSIDLNGNVPGALSTSFATTAGSRYALTFDMAGNPDRRGVKTMEVSVGDQNGVGFTFDNLTVPTSRGAMGWVAETLLFAATGATTTLSFVSTTTSAGAWGPALDNVRVVEQSTVPAPGALGLACIGLFGVAALRRRVIAAAASA